MLIDGTYLTNKICVVVYRDERVKATFFYKFTAAWDYKVFDDDTAYDALDDLQSSQSILSDMEKYFQEVIKAEYVGYDEGHYALVSAAVIDSVMNDIDYRCDGEEYSEWIKTVKNIDFTPLKPIAVKAIDAVLSDKSELNELWAENTELYDLWREDKIAMQNRLK